MIQFSSMFILNTNTGEWTKSPTSIGTARWNFSAVSVKAVPYWKVFMFGGNSGDLEDGNPQGTYLNDLSVLETGVSQWTQPITLGTIPSARGETQLVYEPKQSRMILFGGWANRWFGDLYVCKVADVVGPPYSIDSMYPDKGPITGATKCTITGIGFQGSGTQATVRFACMKGFMEAPAAVLSDTSIEFETPNFEKFGPVNVECRVGVGGRSLTNSIVTYGYFAVTSCETSLAFGPGILSGCIANHKTTVIIQAKDANGLDRVCGMDIFLATANLVVTGKDGKSTLQPAEDIEFQIVDQGDGTYDVSFTYPAAGQYEISIIFDGTFKGTRGNIRGSPFRLSVVDSGDKVNNQMQGPLMMEYIRNKTKDTKDYATKTMKNLKIQPTKEELEPLIKVKETLREVETNRKSTELITDSNRSALFYFKKGGGQMDKMIDALENSSSLWADVTKQAPLTANSIVPFTKVWSANVEAEIDAYCKGVAEKLKESKKGAYWKDDLRAPEARQKIADATKKLNEEKATLLQKQSLCQNFEFPQLVKTAIECIDEMSLDLTEVVKVWDVTENLEQYIAESKKGLWREMNVDELDDGSKNQIKAVKGLHKCVRWSPAFKFADKMSKDFLNTVPLLGLLGAKCMRDRHWKALMTATHKQFTPPYEDKEMLIGTILSLNLHEFSADVEDICDQAAKELKIENTLNSLADRWTTISWLMDLYKDTDVPLLKIAEEDFEALEADQLTVQGMLASRFVKQFEQEAQSWQKHLANVSDVFIIVNEIQRTWSYLEPLFIGSEEVKRELPEDAKRFVGIDNNVKRELKTCWEIKNVDKACNQEGLYKRLEDILGQLEICKKSLSDFLDSRRRQFPRYYFTSESDLLDILSNGSVPEKILKHTAKIYLSTDTLMLDKKNRAPGDEHGDRPYAVGWIAGVGVERVLFEPKVALEGKVEVYMQTVLDAMKLSLFNNLKRSLVRYQKMSRSDWLMHKMPDGSFGYGYESKVQDSSDPAQIILFTVAVNYVEEVEQAFVDIAKGNPNALKEYKAKQVDQLKALIGLTTTDLNKSDRTRVMVCITMGNSI